METKLSIKPAPRVQTKRKQSRYIAGAVLENGVLTNRLKLELFVANQSVVIHNNKKTTAIVKKKRKNIQDTIQLR